MVAWNLPESQSQMTCFKALHKGILWMAEKWTFSNTVFFIVVVGVVVIFVDVVVVVVLVVVAVVIVDVVVVVLEDVLL